MNNTLEPDDGEQSTGYGSSCNGTEDDQAQETSSVSTRLALEEDGRRAVRIGDGDSHCCVEVEVQCASLLALSNCC